MPRGRLSTHGLIKTPIYKTWYGMKWRTRGDERYVKKGIKLSKEWEEFENFFHDMYPSWKRGLTLDRIDNKGNYSKENCRWASRKEQSRNRDITLRVSYEGKETTLSDLADAYEIRYATLIARVRKGWTLEEALSTKTLSKKECGKRSVDSPNHINNRK